MVEAMKILYDSLTFGPTFSVVTFSLPHFRSGQEGRGGGGRGGRGGLNFIIFPIGIARPMKPRLHVLTLLYNICWFNNVRTCSRHVR